MARNEFASLDSLLHRSGPMEKIGPYVLEAGGWRLEKKRANLRPAL
ncbi:MAG TPA: hypothetical protein VFU57_06405 [Candidatus Acidoferrales bacterium]|nr:hypothetical protein [Candidatus Acidoferrales bacterium]